MDRGLALRRIGLVKPRVIVVGMLDLAPAVWPNEALAYPIRLAEAIVTGTILGGRAVLLSFRLMGRP